MKKCVSVFLCLTCVLTFASCGKWDVAAPITLPKPADVTSVDITVGGKTVNHSDRAWIREMLSGLSASEPTSKESVQDVPQTENYIKIDFRFEKGTSTLFAYEDGGKYYVEQPYQGIYEIDSRLYEQMKR